MKQIATQDLFLISGGHAEIIDLTGPETRFSVNLKIGIEDYIKEVPGCPEGYICIPKPPPVIIEVPDWGPC